MKKPSPRQLGQSLRLAVARMRDEFSRWTTYDRLARQVEDVLRTLERLELKYQALRQGIDRDRAEKGLPPFKTLKEKAKVPDVVDLSFAAPDWEPVPSEESPPSAPSSSPPSSESSPAESSGG